MDGFTVIAEPTRRRIVDELRSGERDVTGLVTALGVSQPLVSKHLKVLREAGVVSAEVAGKRRVYRLTDRPLPDVLAWVAPYHRMWSGAFDALAEALDADRNDSDRSDRAQRGSTTGRRRRAR